MEVATVSYNGSGTFQINTSGQPVVAGTVISSTAFNALTADLATGLSTAITKDGQTTTTARIPFAAGINSSSATDSTSTSTGSIITSGGVGIAKALYVGTTLNVTGASTMTGAIAVDSVTDSTSTTTGSIQTDGGVGIAKALFVGTTANIAGVTTVQAGTAALPAITTSGDTNTGIFFPAADTIAFSEGGVESMRIDSSGNVGIGSTSPNIGSLTRALTINTPTGGNYSGVELAGAGTLSARFVTNNAAGTFFGSQLSIPLIFETNATERARITSGGDLLLGTTNSSDTADAGFRAQPSGVATSTLTASGTGDSTMRVYSTGAGAYRFFVRMDGTIFATSIVITAISDERLKENVRDIDTGLNSIMSLKPRRFDWKDGKGQDKKNAAGFIAQEFETVFPECVGTSKAGADGIEYKSINHETLIPTLVKAIQEQQALITQLTARITALESA